MRRSMSLSGTWQVAYSEGLHGAPDQVRHIEVDEARYAAMPVPGEVHWALGAAGMVPD